MELSLEGENQIHVWRGERPSLSILGAPVGQLLLTSERLLFLSAGTSGVPRRVAATLALGVVGHVLFGKTPTAELDLGALENAGSVAIALAEVQSVEVGRRLEARAFVQVRWRAADGVDEVAAFAPELGWSVADAEVWAAAITRARTAVGLLPAAP